MPNSCAVTDTLKAIRNKLTLCTALTATGVALSAFPHEARAQLVVPGVSSQCPIVLVSGVETAICEGDLSDGVVSEPNDPDFDLLIVRNANADIAPADGTAGISVSRNTGDVNLHVEDGITIRADNTSNAQGFGIVAITADGLVEISNAASLTAIGGSAQSLGIQAITTGSPGPITVSNSGSLDATSANQRVFGILAEAQSGGDISISNDAAGGIVARSSSVGERDDGLAAIGAFNLNGEGDIRVENQGTLRVEATPGNVDTDVPGAASAILVNNFGGNNTTTIVTGATSDISAIGTQANGVFAVASSTTGQSVIDIDTDGAFSILGDNSYAILAQGNSGDVVLDVNNSATVTTGTGSGGAILLFASAASNDLNVLNTGALNAGGTFDYAVRIIDSGVPGAASTSVDINNQADLTFAGSGRAISLELLGTQSVVANVINTGAIDLSASTNPFTYAIGAELSGADAGEIAITNSGTIAVGTGNAINASANRFALTNSAALSTTGSGSTAINVMSVGTNSELTFLLDGTSVTTTGPNSLGIAINQGNTADGTVTTVNALGLDIETSGVASDGFLIGARGSVGISNTDLENTFITTTGDQSRGFVLEMPRDDSATSVTVLNSSFETEGASNSAALSIAADPLFDPTTGGASTLIFDITGSTFSTLGSNSAGIEAPDLLGSQSFLVGTLSSLDVSTVGNNSDGVSIGTGASGGNVDTSVSFQLGAVSVDTRGDDSRGIAIDAFRLGLDGSDAFIFAQDSLVSTGGASAHAIDIAGTNGDLLNADLTVVLANNTLATKGDGAHGINLGRAGGNIFSANIDYAFTGNTVTTSGDDAFGLFFDGFGLNSSDSGGGNSNIDIVFSMDDFDIGTAGLGSHAIRFDMSADETSLIADLVNSSITTTGDNAAGLAVSALGEDSNFGITIDATSIATQGNGANAITMGQGDRLVTSSLGLTLTNSIVTSSGDSADAVLFDGLGANSIGVLTIDNSTVTAQGEGSRALAVSLPRTGSSSNIFVTNSILRSEGASDSGAFALLNDPLFDPLANDGSSFSVNLTNSTLSTLGVRSPGILISDFLGSAAGFIGALDGVTVDTAGNDSDAITLGTGQSAGSDDVSITLGLVALDLATQGDNSRGLAIDAIAGGLSDGNVTAFVQGSEITTLGDEAHAIQILNAPGDLLDSTISLVLSETNLSTAGEGAFALDIAGPQGDLEDVVLAVALGDSTLATTGDGAHGINLGRVEGEIISADIDYAFARNTVTTSGDDAYGLLFGGFDFVVTTGPVGENVDIVFSMDDFDISTSGLASHALRFDMSAGRTLVPGELRNSMLTTTGNNAAGVSISPIDALSEFRLIVDSTSISTGGTNAPGITFGEGGNIDDSIVNFTIENSTIITTGAQSEAFRVDAPGGGAILSINLENTAFTTTGDQSRGVVLVSPRGGSATSTTISGFTVNTSGASDSAAFVQSAGASFDPLTENSSAYTINVRDSSFSTVGTNSPGILIADLLGNTGVTLVSLADTDISTAGDNSDGVAIGTGRSNGNDRTSTTISFADFSIAVDGANSRGIVIDAFRNGMESSDALFFLEGNAITTNGNAGHGIEIGGTSGVFQNSLLTFAFLDNAITTNGDGAHGLIIGGLPEFATGDENSVLLALQFDQPLITTGAGSDGVRLGAGWGSAGAMADDRNNNIESRFSSVLVADEISATGEGSVAFRTSSLINLFEISETGSITGDAAAILSEGDGGFEKFTNAGTIMGDIILGDEDTVLDSSGIITGNIDMAGGANALFIRAGGRLNSLDTIALGTGNDITVEGILSPGSDAVAQTTTIDGNLILTAGSTLFADIADAGSSDLINVNGTVTLQGGALRVVELGAFAMGNVFDAVIIGNDGSDAVAGTFGSVINDFAFLTPSVTYTGGDGNDVALTLTRNNEPTPPPPPPPPPPSPPPPPPSPPPPPPPPPPPTGGGDPQPPAPLFPTGAQTFNQTQSATALDTFDETPGSDTAEVFNAFLFLTRDEAPPAFDAVSGEIYASLLAQAGFDGLARSREILARARRATTQGWGIWGGLGGSDSAIDGDGNGARVHSDNFGFDLGIDYAGFDNGWALGVAGGARNGDLDVAARASEADFDSWYLSAYGRYGTGGTGFTVSGALSFTQSDDIATGRTIIVNNLARTARGSTDTEAFALAAEARYGLSVVDQWAIGPVASLIHVDAHLGAVRESGAQSLNLTSESSSDDQTVFGIGGFVNFQDGASTFDLSAQYVDGGTNAAAAVLTLEGSPDAPFTILAPKADNSGVLASVSGQIELGSGWTIGVQADGLLGSDFEDVTASAMIGWRF